MDATIGKGYNIDDCRHLAIDPGRYLAIDDDGEYVISTTPQLIKGIPYGRPSTPIVRGGAKPGNRTFRRFIVDRGDTLDLVGIGTILVHDCWIWVAGDTIWNENGEEDDDEFEEYLPIMVHKYPKRKPPNMSVNQVRVNVKKQTFLKMFADMKKAGIEPPDTENYDLVVDPRTLSMYMERKRKTRRIHICQYGKIHICPLMVSIAKPRKKTRRI